MSEASTGESLPDERPKPGRPRKYASAADRVRAYRERERQKREAASLAEPTTPRARPKQPPTWRPPSPHSAP
ncbi:hypothetical protein ACFQZK_31470 [Rhodococcus aetherivorans]